MKRRILQFVHGIFGHPKKFCIKGKYFTVHCNGCGQDFIHDFS